MARQLTDSAPAPSAAAVAQGPRVLLVDDERKLVRSLQKVLERSGFSVGVAFDGVEAVERAMTGDFDILVLDLNLPRKSGFLVLQELRASTVGVPVIVLSARDSVQDRVKCLELGADDYIVKPFDSGELICRLQAVLRRSGMARTATLQVADLILDTSRRVVTRAGRQIDLSPKEMALLEFLMRNKNEILSRKRITEQVWGYEFDTGTNIVDVYISYLRKAVDEGFSKKLIYTVHGQGFLLSER